MHSRNVVLISRLPLHGRFLFKLLSRHFNVFWVGEELSCKLNILNSLYILLQEFLKLIWLFKERRYSAIVVQYISLDGIPALFVKRLFGIRVVLFAIGSDVLRIREHSFAYPIIRWIMEHSDLVLCTNTLIEKSLKRVCNVKTKVIPSALDIEDFTPYKGPKKYDLVTIGSLRKEKNHDLLLKACSLLRTPVKILIIGDGPMRGFLESMSRERGLDVKFLGDIPHKQVYTELQKSKVYVHTSKSEGLPVSVMEAIYSRLPIILVESAYLVDLRKYGFNLNVSRDDAKSLADAIERVLSNYDREKELASLNSQKVKGLVEETSLSLRRVLEEITGAMSRK